MRLGHAIGEQQRAHRLGRRDDRIQLRALRQREACAPARGRCVAAASARSGADTLRTTCDRSRSPESPCARQSARRRSAPETAYECEPGRTAATAADPGTAQRAEFHPPVLRIARHAAGSDPEHARFIGNRGDRRRSSRRRFIGRRARCGVARSRAVTRRYQHAVNADVAQVGAEGADRGGNAVDAREIDVGDEQHPHPAGASCSAAG